MNTRVKAVTLDVGGTLIAPWPSVGTIYAAVAAEFGCGSFAPELLDARFLRAWKRHHSFGYSLPEWRQVVEATFEGLCVVDEPLFDAVYDRFNDPHCWRIHADVLPALQTLVTGGLKIAAITNWDARIRPLLDRLELAPWFEAILVSGELGFHKPDARIFQTAARLLQIAPQSILHIGDSTREDLEGATAAGFQARLLDRSSAGEAPLHDLCREACSL